MLSFLESSSALSTCLFAALGAVRLWYSVPLIVSVSLVCAATRHEEMGAIVAHAVRFGLWIVVFMGIVLCLIQFLSWLQ